MTAAAPATAPATPTKPPMSLANVKRGVVTKPMRILIYGTEGVGKTTFAAGAPSPIFLGTEDGSAQLDVARFPEPRSWEDIHAAITELSNAKHSFQTLVVDTVDWAEPMSWDYVCRSNKKKSIEDFGYGKGYVAALDAWRELLARLDVLRTKGMHIVLVGHAWVKSFRNPEGEDFDRYELKLHGKVAGLLKEWTDCVLFANYETFVATKDEKSWGVDNGARMIHTTRRAAFDAKNRYELPPKLPLSYEDFAAALSGESNVDALVARCEQLLGRAPAELATVVRSEIVKSRKDARRLAKIANRLAAKVAAAAEAQTGVTQ